MRSLERATRSLADVWHGLSLDARIVGAVGMANWALLFASHTTVAVTGDVLIWRLFPGGWGAVYLIACGASAATYVLRDHVSRRHFTSRDRAIHLAATLVVFALAPTLASLVLRLEGEPYTYIHDGALMIEAAARKLIAGQNPYVANYLDTPLYYWPMINNPALYHLTYFPLLYLVTVPFVWAFDTLGLAWDERFLYLPAYVATLAILPLLVRSAEERLALVALVGLNPQLYPFVVEGRNDFFVLAFLFLGIALLQRERRALGALAIAAAAGAKLHATLLIPFVVVWLLATRRPRTFAETWRTLWPTLAPATALLAAVFVPVLVNNFGAFWDDVVSYNAGGAAWSYPISGVGFSAILLRIGAIPYAQAEFPFAAIEIAVAIPLAIWWLWRLWRAPSLATLLTGYAVTLLAFLFFGRYFQGNYLGFVTAIATPVPFLARERALAARRLRALAAPRLGRGGPAGEPPTAKPAPADAAGPRAETAAVE